MHASVFSWWPLLLAATAAGPVGAQPTPAPASPPVYRSAFEGYRAYDDQPTSNWKAANDTVGRIGGWRAYAREASGDAQPPGQRSPASADGTSAAPAASPGAQPPGSSHGHHGHHR